MTTAGEYFDGAKIIADWLGDGGKPDPQAQDRADVCTGRLSGKPCPYNYLGPWLIPTAIANTIRAYLEHKNKLALRVEGEEKLGHCECCGCVLALKVHTPRDNIMAHTKKEDYEKYPSFCWMITEEPNKP